MKNKRKKKTHKDKHGCEFLKETYFVGGKMQFHKIYLTDGMSADKFYEKNATDMDFYLNGDYELMSCNKNFENQFGEQKIIKLDSEDKADLIDLPF